MKQQLKSLLKTARIYYPLQAVYRRMLNRLLRLQYLRDYKRYAGHGFTCNVCDARYERFVPWLPKAEDAGALKLHHVISGYGDNIICPNCLSTARERLVLVFLNVLLKPQGRVLHLAPESPVYNYLSKKASVTTADLEPGFYTFLDERVVKADATSLPFESNYFGLVVANHILEHIPDDRQAMREIYRVLQPGGTAVLQVPYSAELKTTIEDPGISNPALQSKLFGQQDHVRIYGIDDYIARLRETGFEVEIVETANYKSHAVQEGEVFFHIKKPR